MDPNFPQQDPAERPEWAPPAETPAETPGTAPDSEASSQYPSAAQPSPAPEPAWPGDAYPPTYPTAAYTPPPYSPSAPPAWVDMAPVQPRRDRRLGRVAGVAGLALLAAVVGSGATVGALATGGYLDRPTSAPAAAATTNTSNPSVTTDITNVPTSDTASAAAKALPSVVTIEILGAGGQTAGAGSGIVFDSNGWILTNRHVATAGSSFMVDLADGRRLPATVYGTDTLTDLAIMKVNATGLTAATLGSSSNVQVGEPVLAIGDPLGTYPNSVTSGIVSGLNRSITAGSQGSGFTEDLSDLIQTDAAINPGNSGGPLVDLNGHVIGVNTAGSTQAQGMGFAIPIDLAKPLMQQALAGQQLARPWLGVSFVDIDPTVATQNNLSVTSGAWITASGSTGGSAIIAGSPAAQAGLRANDIITAVDGVKIDQTHSFIELMSTHGPGSKVTLSVLRGGQTLTITVTLATRPAQ